MTKLPKEILLTHPADHCCGQSIEYQFNRLSMFTLKKTSYILFADAPIESDIVLEVGETTIEEFLVDPSIVKCSQLSDHYGVATTLCLNKRVQA